MEHDHDPLDVPRLLFARVHPAGRVDHLCVMCRGTIPAGQPKVKTVVMTTDDEKPWITYTHPEHEHGPDDEF